jgi:hypothetical protein
MFEPPGRCVGQRPSSNTMVVKITPVTMRCRNNLPASFMSTWTSRQSSPVSSAPRDAGGDEPGGEVAHLVDRQC